MQEMSSTCSPYWQPYAPISLNQSSCLTVLFIDSIQSDGAPCADDTDTDSNDGCAAGSGIILR